MNNAVVWWSRGTGTPWWQLFSSNLLNASWNVHNFSNMLVLANEWIFISLELHFIELIYTIHIALSYVMTWSRPVMVNLFLFINLFILTPDFFFFLTYLVINIIILKYFQKNMYPIYIFFKNQMNIFIFIYNVKY